MDTSISEELVVKMGLLQYVMDDFERPEVDWRKLTAQDWLTIMRWELGAVGWKQVGSPTTISDLHTGAKADITTGHSVGDLCHPDQLPLVGVNIRVVNPHNPYYSSGLVPGGGQIFVTEAAKLVARRGTWNGSTSVWEVFYLDDGILLRQIQADLNGLLPVQIPAVVHFLSELKAFLVADLLERERKLRQRRDQAARFGETLPRTGVKLPERYVEAVDRLG